MQTSRHDHQAGKKQRCCLGFLFASVAGAGIRLLRLSSHTLGRPLALPRLAPRRRIHTKAVRDGSKGCAFGKRDCASGRMARPHGASPEGFCVSANKQLMNTSCMVCFDLYVALIPKGEAFGKADRPPTEWS